MKHWLGNSFTSCELYSLASMRLLHADSAFTLSPPGVVVYTSSYRLPCLLVIMDSIDVANPLSCMRRPNSMLRFSAL